MTDRRSLNKSMDTLFPQPVVVTVRCEECGWSNSDTDVELVVNTAGPCPECDGPVALMASTAAYTCRVCEEEVVDGRWNYCSERCRDIANDVQSKFLWKRIREDVLERDDHTCQRCGLSKEMARRAYNQSRELVDERVPGSTDLDLETEEEYARWRDARWRTRARFVPESPSAGMFHVDHIEPLSKGGHPFDEDNLQVLCKHCHAEKTAEENGHA